METYKITHQHRIEELQKNLRADITLIICNHVSTSHEKVVGLALPLAENYKQGCQFYFIILLPD